MAHKHFSEEEIILLAVQENDLSLNEINVCPQCSKLYQQYIEVLNSTKLVLNKPPDYSPEKIKDKILQKLADKNKKILLPHINMFKVSLYPALAVVIILLVLFFPHKNNNNLSSEETQIVQNIEILQNAELFDNLDLFLSEDLDENSALINSNGNGMINSK